MTLVPEAPYQSAQPGDDVYLGSVVAKLHLWGQVSDLDTPAMMRGSLEVLGDDMALVMDALVGPRGPAGAPSPIVKMQWSSSITDPADLPKHYLNIDDDKGKAFWIGNILYVWSGTRWQMHAMGSPGPAGPVPRITPSFEVLDKTSLDDESIDLTGTTTHPHWHMKIPGRKIIGPPGPAAAIEHADDYDNSEPMEAGKVLTVIQNPAPGAAPGDFLWGPRRFVSRHVKMFTIPEGMFENYSGWNNVGHTVCTYQIPPQPFDYVPHVTGHIRAGGIVLSLNPLQIGIEVRLGHVTSGAVIGRGHGVAHGWSVISPHFSNPGEHVNTAATPDPANRNAVVEAGETATLYFRLVNDGLPGIYVFNNQGAQGTVLCVPKEMLGPESY